MVLFSSLCRSLAHVALFGSTADARMAVEQRYIEGGFPSSIVPKLSISLLCLIRCILLFSLAETEDDLALADGDTETRYSATAAATYDGPDDLGEMEAPRIAVPHRPAASSSSSSRTAPASSSGPSAAPAPKRAAVATRAAPAPTPTSRVRVAVRLRGVG